jgi:hypothetical protein
LVSALLPTTTALAPLVTSASLFPCAETKTRSAAKSKSTEAIRLSPRVGDAAVTDPPSAGLPNTEPASAASDSCTATAGLPHAEQALLDEQRQRKRDRTKANKANKRKTPDKSGSKQVNMLPFSKPANIVKISVVDFLLFNFSSTVPIIRAYFT